MTCPGLPGEGTQPSLPAGPTRSWAQDSSEGLDLISRGEWGRKGPS